MIKIGNKTISKVCVGDTEIIKICVGDTVVYEVSSPVDTYAVIETDITTYQGTATKVYILDEDKWYMRTIGGDYRQYGIIAQGKPLDPYIGELCVDNGHEWEYTSSGWSDLGEGEVKYIESPDYLARNASNKGWIDLGFIYDAQTRVQMKVDPQVGTGSFWLGDAYNPSDNQDCRFFGTSRTTIYWDTEDKRCNTNVNVSLYPITIELAPQYIKNLTTGTNIASTSAPTTIDRHGYTWQYAKSGQGEYINLYWLKVYQNDVLVKDFLPMVKNGVYGLYEQVSGTEVYPQNGTVSGSTNTTRIDVGTIVPVDYTPIPAPIPVSTIYITAENEYLKNGSNYYCKDYEYDVYEGGAKEATGNYIQGDQLTPTYVQGDITDFTVYNGGKYYKDYIYVTPVSTALATGDWVRGDYIAVAEVIASGTTKASTDFTVKVNNADRTAYIDGSAGSSLYYFKVYDDGNPITTMSGFTANNSNIVSCNFTQIVHSQTCMFQGAFYECSNLTSAPTLPATTLQPYCYNKMFQYCRSLTSAPALPATTLANYCYQDMFMYCQNLTTAPTLPAETLTQRCYQSMFHGCSRLTTAPTLPATTLATYCYQSMFYGCTSLTTAPALPATTLAQFCYYDMFDGCRNLTSAPALPAETLANYCYQYMFAGCTNLTTAPSLPAETLANYCYSNMFNNCTSLTSAPALPATTVAPYCYESMFQSCTSLTTAPSTLPATTAANNCYWYMFSGCRNLTSAPQLPATTLASNCYKHMFYDCSGLTSAPELPATTLTNNCYAEMFQNCRNLNYIKAMFTTPPSNTYTSNWVNGVASTGTFVKNANAQWDVTGNNGIPTGWTVQTT